MEGLPARADIDVRCCRVTRRRHDLESSIRRRDRRRIIREWALLPQDRIFGMDTGPRNLLIESTGAVDIIDAGPAQRALDIRKEAGPVQVGAGIAE